MKQFEIKKLANGLSVIVVSDNRKINSLLQIHYKVGASSEDLNAARGVAHLLEHLAFTYRSNAKTYDELIVELNGECDAYTSEGSTSYIVDIPTENLQTAISLEALRMTDLALDEEDIEIQKKVIIQELKEEYNAVYENIVNYIYEQIYYGLPLGETSATILIENTKRITKKDVEEFYQKYYAPQNAVLCVTTNEDPNKIFEWVDKYFGAIENPPSFPKTEIAYLDKPVQPFKEVIHNYSRKMIMNTFLCTTKYHDNSLLEEIIASFLSGGESSALYLPLVNQKRLFSDITARIVTDEKQSLFIIEAKFDKQTRYEDANNILWETIDEILEKGMNEKDLLKQINQHALIITLQNLSISNIAEKLIDLCLANKLELFNTEIEHLKSIKLEDINAHMRKLLRRENAALLHLGIKEN